ncbi:MAG TPA: hypothetical protein VGH11_16590 [Jatrophihabitans sp.]|jgi:hypothetical protein
MTTGAPADATSMTRADVEGWIAKAHGPVGELLALPGVPASPSVVISRAAESAKVAPYGGFMLSWPEQEDGVQVLNHLPDGGFFLDLLRRVYEPILSRRPRLAEALGDHSRVEMAITNDVLQVQLNQLADGYTMIRHHALMLFESVLWVTPASRRLWTDLFEASTSLAMAERSAPPTVAELDDIEAAGFAAMVAYAADSADEAGALELLGSPALEPIVTYQLWASAAIGLLWRDFASVPQERRLQWHQRELIAYRDLDYLCDRLRAEQRAVPTEGSA